MLRFFDAPVENFKESLCGKHRIQPMGRSEVIAAGFLIDRVTSKDAVQVQVVCHLMLLSRISIGKRLCQTQHNQGMHLTKRYLKIVIAVFSKQ